MKCTEAIHAAVLSGDAEALRQYTQHCGYMRRGNEVRECCGQGCRKAFYVLTTYNVGVDPVVPPTPRKRARVRI